MNFFEKKRFYKFQQNTKREKTNTHTHTRCIQKFTDCTPGVSTANGTALCH